jgi:hypothetical protein
MVNWYANPTPRASYSLLLGMPGTGRSYFWASNRDLPIMPKTEVGWIDLGIMGLPMARNLQRKGFLVKIVPTQWVPCLIQPEKRMPSISIVEW